MMKYYIAYGSNLNLAQMKYRCPKARLAGTGWLEGYRLLFKGSKTGSYLTIEKDEKHKVPIAVWKVSDEDESALDIYEGCPTFYYKKTMKITFTSLRGLKVRDDAFVYIMHEDRELGVPSQRYLDTCVDGYLAFKFDTRYLQEALNYSYLEV